VDNNLVQFDDTGARPVRYRVSVKIVS